MEGWQQTQHNTHTNFNINQSRNTICARQHAAACTDHCPRSVSRTKLDRNSAWKSSVNKSIRFELPPAGSPLCIYNSNTKLHFGVTMLLLLRNGIKNSPPPLLRSINWRWSHEQMSSPPTLCFCFRVLLPPPPLCFFFFFSLVRTSLWEPELLFRGYRETYEF